MKFNNRLNKKGQGLPLNTIIIAIIVIVVLVIIIIIFSGNILNFQNASNSGNECRQAGGTCISDNTCSTLGGHTINGKSCGSDTTVICCGTGKQ